MQNAYASYQVTQAIGCASNAPTVGVQVNQGVHDRSCVQSSSVVAMPAFHDGSQPVSNPPPTATRPAPPFKWACFPAPAFGSPAPRSTAVTKRRKRATVTSYASRRNGLTCAGAFGAELRSKWPPATSWLAQSAYPGPRQLAGTGAHVPSEQYSDPRKHGLSSCHCPPDVQRSGVLLLSLRQRTAGAEHAAASTARPSTAPPSPTVAGGSASL